METHHPQWPEKLSSIFFEELAEISYYLSREPDGKFKFVSVNQNFLDATGLSEDQVVGHTVDEIIPMTSLPIVLDHYQAAIDRKSVDRWIEISRYPNGEKQGRVSIAPVFDDNNECTGLVGTVSDITPITSEPELTNMIDRVIDGFVSFDKNMNYKYVNPQAGKFLGRLPNDLIGKNYFEEYPEAKGTIFANSYLEALKTQTPQDFTALYPAWNKYFENRVYPSDSGITILFSDVTERVKKEETLREALKQAEQANDLKIRILDIAAHEFRNPVTTIYMMIHAMMRRLDKGQIIDREQLEKLLVPSERLSSLVNELLDLSKLEKDRVEIKPAHHDLADLLEQWLTECRLGRQDREFIMNISEHPLEANFDETKISQVFFNLLDNALKFSPPGSPIMISAGKDNEFIFVSVTDKGEGIKPEIIPHLFDPFMRGGYDIKLRHHGLGLGLSISNQLIQLHGGKIEVISTVGVGSTFTFKIPHQGMTHEP